MHPYCKLLAKEFEHSANAERAVGAKKYMRNLFEFYGIASPERRLISKVFIAEHGYPDDSDMHDVVHDLWKLEQREFQYFAMDMMYSLRKRWKENEITLFAHCITHRSWWDTVDFIASKLVGGYCKKFPELTADVIEPWIESDNMWLNRTAIIFQIGYKEKTDTDLLTQAILPHIQSKEFFHGKAIGWALRSYSYTNPDWVKKFVAEHPLKPLSVREGVKAINRDGL